MNDKVILEAFSVGCFVCLICCIIGNIIIFCVDRRERRIINIEP